jgi:hypothetical protein
MHEGFYMDYISSIKMRWILASCALILTPLAAIGQAAYIGSPYTVSLAGTGLPSTSFPDGILTVIWDAAKSESQIFWAENESFGSYGSSVLSAGNAYSVLGAPPVSGYWGSVATSTGDRSHPTYFDNSGSWLMSAFRVDQGTLTLDPHSSYLIGFYHGEDHWYTDAGTSNSYYHDPVAWIGVGLTTSTNGGSSWSKGGMILGVPDLKPEYPSPFTASNPNAPWGGIGNQCTVLDVHSNPSQPAWVTFFPMIDSTGLTTGHGITAARTTDPSAARDNWYAYYDGSFGTQQEYNEGEDSPLPGLDGSAGSDYDHYALSNPSVHWNTYLGRWVLMAATWDGTKIMISYSTTASVSGGWTSPVEVITAPSGSTVRYPTVVGTDHTGYLNSTESGQNATIYWAQFNSADVRTMMADSVTFDQ